MKLYVGNLPYTTTEDDLRSLFSTYGAVSSVAIITDRDTGRSKGFAFVEMATDEAAEKAIADFNGQKIEGRPMTVNEAKPQQPREGRMGGGGGGGGGRRHGFGGR